MRRTYCGHDNPDDYLFCGVCGSPLAEVAPRSARTVKDESSEKSKTVYSQIIRQQESSPLDPLDPPAETRTDTVTAPLPEVRASDFAASSESRPLREPPSVYEPSPYVSGPSLLGLDGPPTQSEVRYLLEDESPTGQRRALALALILVLAAVGWWQVRMRGGTPWLKAHLQRLESPKAGAPSPAATDNTSLAQESANQNSTNQNSTNQGSTDNATTPGAAQTANSEQQAQSPTAKSEGSGKPPSEAASPGAMESTASQLPSASQPPEAKSVAHDNPQPAQNGLSNPDQSAKPGAVVSSELDSAPVQAVKRQPAVDDDLAASKPAARSEVERASKVTQPVASDKEDETSRLAEKYLYGNGVPQDCNRAVTLLRPAADSSNSKAQTLLGAMYATGHCVPRDLPSSYRWFALALRQQPKNIWLEKNLESVWNQMSSSQKQLAMRMTNSSR